MRAHLMMILVSALSLVFPARAGITPERIAPTFPQAGAKAGSVSAMDGDLMVVGSPGYDGIGADSGLVEMYRWNGTGWVSEGFITGQSAGDGFGTSVAASGDTVVIGAPYRNVGANADQGVAYVCTRSNGVWMLSTELKASDGKANDVFGLSVGISGNAIVAGAYGADIGLNSNQGAAYVYTRSSGIWTQQAKLTNSSGAAADRLGYAVAISGETIVAGAWGDDVGAQADQGSASVFARVGGIWSYRAMLFDLNGLAGDGFGVSVAIDDRVIAVGAPYDNVGANADAGSVCIFERAIDSDTWALKQNALTAADAAPGDKLGWSVAVSGRTVIAGAPGDDSVDPVLVDSGSAYIFSRGADSNTWKPVTAIRSPTPAASNIFGQSVALFGSMAAIGSPNSDVSASDAGEVWVIEKMGSWMTQPHFVREAQASVLDLFGQGCDLDGDYMVIGVPGADLFGNGAGKAILYHWNGAEWTRTATFGAEAGAGELFGSDVAISGNLIVVGSPKANGDRGRARLYRIVSPTALTFLGSMEAPPEQSSTYLGNQVAIDGDAIAVGALLDSSDTGSVRTYFVSGNSIITGPRLFASDAAPGARFGEALDLEGDTLVVGAEYADSPHFDCGAAYIFKRMGTSWTEAYRIIDDFPVAQTHFADTVAVSGDLVLIGHARGNKAYAYVGPNFTPASRVLIAPPEGTVTSQFPAALATDGDRIVAAAWDFTNDQYPEGGEALVVFQRRGFSVQFSHISRLPAEAMLAYYPSLGIDGPNVAIGHMATNTFTGSASVHAVSAASLTTVVDRAGGKVYPSIAAAFDGSSNSPQLIVGSPGFHNVLSADGNGDYADIRATGSARLAQGSSLVANFWPSLSVPDELAVYGTLRPTGSSVINASNAHFGPRSSLLPADDLIFDVDRFTTLGTTRLTDGALSIFSKSTTLGGTFTALNETDVYIQGPLEISGTTTMEGGDLAAGNTIVTGVLNASDVSIFAPGLTIASNGRFTGRGSIYASVVNFKTMTFNGTSYIVGNSLANATGATINIQAGTLFFSGGSLFNNGTITGSFCCRAPGGLDIEGDLIAGDESSLLLPEGAIVRVTGNTDLEINAYDRWTMRAGELRIDGNGVPQTLEAMSSDEGATNAGLTQAAGRFPIGVLTIRPNAMVELVDNRDNDGYGLSATEAIYAETVVIGSGATLLNDRVTVYYRALINDGAASSPWNLVKLPALCIADFDFDGFVTGDDFDAYVNAFEEGDPIADVTGDGFVTGDDFDVYVAAFEEGC